MFSTSEIALTVKVSGMKSLIGRPWLPADPLVFFIDQTLARYGKALVGVVHGASIRTLRLTPSANLNFGIETASLLRPRSTDAILIVTSIIRV